MAFDKTSTSEKIIAFTTLREELSHAVNRIKLIISQMTFLLPNH